MNEPDVPLPPVHVAEIDQEKLNELFTDVAALGQRLEIVIKRGAERQVDLGPCTSLADAMTQLVTGGALGVQLRYRFQEAEWWDTVMRTPGGFRLVRIRQ